MNPEILELVNVTHEDEGWYACLASNSLGNTMSKAYLQVVDEMRKLYYNSVILFNLQYFHIKETEKKTFFYFKRSSLLILPKLIMVIWYLQ